jgi:hypothetical protein
MDRGLLIWKAACQQLLKSGEGFQGLRGDSTVHPFKHYGNPQSTRGPAERSGILLK